jgi:hypothetical protein
VILPNLGALPNLLLEPTLGLPLLASAWAIVAWFAWSPRPTERPPLLRRTWFPPTSDLASVVYYSLADGRYSAVLTTLYERLDSAVGRQYGRVIAQLPRWSWSARKAKIPEAPMLRSVARQIRQVHGEAVQRESSFWIRWTFWRRAEVDEARFLRRIDRAIAAAAPLISGMEGNA